MAILIFGDAFTFPEGKASTNRVYTYAKGFYENGESVYVISFGCVYNNLAKGMINGIKFYHPFGQRNRSEYFIVRRWYKFIKYFKTIVVINNIHKNDKIETIIVHTYDFSTHLFAWFFSRITKSILINDCCEHPLSLYHNGALKKQQGLIKMYIESRLSDGILCISNFLIEFFKNHGISARKLFLNPSTVEPDRFLKTSEIPLPYQYLGYFGALTFKRDNIDLLIKAFSIISKKHPEIHLVLGGFGSDKDKEQILNLIQELEISSKAEILNYMSRNEILSYITHATILVMVRGNDIQSQASFPSKLTEYLCTSIPVVTLNVGEISNYLSDGINAFLVEPENFELLAEKLDYVLNNYAFAVEVALKGKELTDTVFNYKLQAKRITDYIDTISN